MSVKLKNLTINSHIIVLSKDAEEVLIGPLLCYRRQQYLPLKYIVLNMKWRFRTRTYYRSGEPLTWNAFHV